MIRSMTDYGWIPDIPDRRDYLYSAIRPVIRLPKRVDLREGCSDVEYQGRLGSCTAQALAGNLEFLDKKIDSEYTDVSRLFIYYNERALMETVDYDSGASLRDGIKTLKNDGACHEETWPYKIARFDVKPPVKCYAEGKLHRIESYHRLSTIREMLACLAEGYPFVFGFTVYESFESQELKRTGIDLLAGRALKRTMHPFIAAELNKTFSLEHALRYGLIPLVVAAQHPEHVTSLHEPHR